VRVVWPAGTIARGGDDAFSNAEAELDRDGFRRRDGQLVHRERIVAETCFCAPG